MTVESDSLHFMLYFDKGNGQKQVHLATFRPKTGTGEKQGKNTREERADWPTLNRTCFWPQNDQVQLSLSTLLGFNCFWPYFICFWPTSPTFSQSDVPIFIYTSRTPERAPTRDESQETRETHDNKHAQSHTTSNAYSVHHTRSITYTPPSYVHTYTRLSQPPPTSI